MVSILLSLIETQAKRIFRNCKHDVLQESIQLKKKEFEEIKNSFEIEEQEQINGLLQAFEDYIDDVRWEEKDNCVILALKIGIELGRYFEVLEDL